MDVLLKNLTKEEFLGSKSSLLFEDSVSNNRFAELKSDDIISYRFAWYSDLIQPEISEINSSVFSIGIDQNFAIIDFKNDSIPLILNLNYNFFKTEIFKDWLFIITELAIIKVDRNTFQILEEIALPEFFERIVFKDDKIEIKCVGNITIEKS